LSRTLPKLEVRPYSNQALVALPLGLTVALRVAPLEVNNVAGFVVAVGSGRVLKGTIAPTFVPAELVAFTRK
jgi:hypothetical protein